MKAEPVLCCNHSIVFLRSFPMYQNKVNTQKAAGPDCRHPAEFGVPGLAGLVRQPQNGFDTNSCSVSAGYIPAPFLRTRTGCCLF